MSIHCQPRDWLAPSLSRTLKEFCILAVKQLWQWAAHTLEVTVLWRCWSRLGNVQHRDSFLLRPSQYQKNLSVNYNQWKLLLRRRPPSLFPNKNVFSAFSNGGRSWWLPWCTTWELWRAGQQSGKPLLQGGIAHETSPSLHFWLKHCSQQVLVLPGSDSSHVETPTHVFSACCGRCFKALNSSHALFREPG